MCGNSSMILCAVFPFNHCSSRLIVTCGGIDTSRCTWSFDTCPFMILHRVSHRSLGSDPALWPRRLLPTRASGTSSSIPGVGGFRIRCARRVGILPFLKLTWRRCELKPSPKGEGLTPPRSVSYTHLRAHETVL